MGITKQAQSSVNILIISILAFLYQGEASAQYLYDIGIGGGLSGYTGELSKVPFVQPGYSISGLYRANINPRFAVRLEVNAGSINGYSTDVTNTFPKRIQGDYPNVSAKFFGVDMSMEVNFFPYPLQTKIRNSKNFTPYSFIGIGTENYSPTSIDIEVTGEGNTSLSIPFGIGARWMLGEHVGIQLQFKVLKLFKDDIDGTQMDDPYSLEPTNLYNNDWIYTSTVMITYSFGEDLWNCNCPDLHKYIPQR